MTDGLQLFTVCIQYRDCIQRETWGMEPYDGADCFALSHSRIQRLVFRLNNDECQLIFHQLVKMEQPIGKGIVRGRGRERWDLTLCL